MKKILQLAFCMLFLFSCQNKCKECISADFFQNKKIECIVLEKQRNGTKCINQRIPQHKQYIPLYILTLKSADSIFKIDTDKFYGSDEVYESKVGETIIIENKKFERKRAEGSWGKVVDKYKRECSEEEFILVIKFSDTLMTINNKKMYYDWGIGGRIFKMADGKLKNTDVLFEINEQNSKNGRY